MDIHKVADAILVVVSVIVMTVFIVAGVAIFAIEAHAQQAPVLIDPNTGKFLGNLNRNHMDPNSVYNPHGQYGNHLNPNSVNSYQYRYNQWLQNPYRTPQPPSPNFNEYSY